MGLNFCSSTAIELMGTYHTTNLSMLLPLLITTALLQLCGRLPLVWLPLVWLYGYRLGVERTSWVMRDLDAI